MTMHTEDTAGTQPEGAERLAQAAGDVAQEAGRVAETRASQTMTQVGETLDQVARAVRDAGEGMRDERPEIAGVADTAAEQVERASQYLREHDAREVVEAAQDVARRQPLAVVAGGLALGLLVGRFLRSTAAVTGSGPGDSRRAFGRNGGAYGSRSRTFDRSSQAALGGGYGGGYAGAGSTVPAGMSGTQVAPGTSVPPAGSIDTASASRTTDDAPTTDPDEER